MGCCHAYFTQTGTGDDAFTIDASRLTFGAGCLKETGDQARALGMSRVAVYTDARVRRLPHFDTVVQSLQAAGIDFAVYDQVRVEPTDESFRQASRFAQEGRFDGFVSVGGGSVMDTCKAANLYSSHPAEFLTYVNAPVGDGKPVPGALKPHIACPTTAGTGSEATGMIFNPKDPTKFVVAIQHPSSVDLGLPGSFGDALWQFDVSGVNAEFTKALKRGCKR